MIMTVCRGHVAGRRVGGDNQTMSQLSMITQERDDFLTAVRIAVVSVERADGPPLSTPVWYRYSPGGVIEFYTGRATEKTALLERAGHATLCVQREELPYAYVAVEGTVEIAELDDETRVDIASRYLGEELGRAYVDGNASRDEVLVRLRPEHWRTSDFSKVEFPSG